MSTSSPLLSSERTINAPVSRVWQELSDLSAMGRRSPQCKKMITLGKPNNMVGSVTLNFNRRGWLWWPTWSVITEWQKDTLLEFRVPLNNSRWRFRLSPSPDAPDQGATHVVHERIVDGDTTKLSHLLVRIGMGGLENFERELLQGMQETLNTLKQECER